jgi:hypothetical protein
MQEAKNTGGEKVMSNFTHKRRRAGYTLQRTAGVPIF